MHRATYVLKDFTTIKKELLIILRESRYIFATKRKSSTKIKQGNTFTWVALKFHKTFHLFSEKRHQCCILQLLREKLIIYQRGEIITKELLSSIFKSYLVFFYVHLWKFLMFLPKKIHSERSSYISGNGIFISLTLKCFLYFLKKSFYYIMEIQLL